MIKTKLFKSRESKEYKDFERNHEVIRTIDCLKIDEPYSFNREEFIEVYYKEDNEQ